LYCSTWNIPLPPTPAYVTPPYLTYFNARFGVDGFVNNFPEKFLFIKKVVIKKIPEKNFLFIKKWLFYYCCIIKKNS
jgi:hypothetical protein